MAGTSLIVEEQLTTFHGYYLAKKKIAFPFWPKLVTN
jgi:hypothetical protein